MAVESEEPRIWSDRERKLNYHIRRAIQYLEYEKYPDGDRVVLALATLKTGLEEKPKLRRVAEATEGGEGHE